MTVTYVGSLEKYKLELFQSDLFEECCRIRGFWAVLEWGDLVRVLDLSYKIMYEFDEENE